MDPKLLCILLLLIFNLSCENDDIKELDFEFETIETFSFPDQQVSVKFNIIPKGGIEPYSIKWIDSHLASFENPFTIYADTTQVLDFEITDASQNKKKFTYELIIDEIRTQAKDFRYKYIGSYEYEVTRKYEGKTSVYRDTLNVTLINHDFYDIGIKIKVINGKWIGDALRYLSVNRFYGYHSGAYFTEDSIFYTASGPMGAYYTNVYKGRKIIQ